MNMMRFWAVVYLLSLPQRGYGLPDASFPVLVSVLFIPSLPLVMFLGPGRAGCGKKQSWDPANFRDYLSF